MLKKDFTFSTLLIKMYTNINCLKLSQFMRVTGEILKRWKSNAPKTEGSTGDNLTICTLTTRSVLGFISSCQSNISFNICSSFSLSKSQTCLIAVMVNF